MNCQIMSRVFAASLHFVALLGTSGCAVVEGIGSEIASVSRGLVDLVAEHGMDIAETAVNAKSGTNAGLGGSQQSDGTNGGRGGSYAETGPSQGYSASDLSHCIRLVTENQSSFIQNDCNVKLSVQFTPTSGVGRGKPAATTVSAGGRSVTNRTEGITSVLACRYPDLLDARSGYCA